MKVQFNDYGYPLAERKRDRGKIRERMKERERGEGGTARRSRKICVFRLGTAVRNEQKIPFARGFIARVRPILTER